MRPARAPRGPEDRLLELVDLPNAAFHQQWAPKRLWAEYSLRDRGRRAEEGLAYLKLAQLRSNYLQIVAAVNEALEAGVEPKKLLGIDVPGVEVSARYFEYLAGKAEDAELALACRTALGLLAGAATKKQDKLDAKKRDFLEARKREHADSDSMSRKKVREDHATAGGPVPEAPQDGTSGATTSEEAASEVAASEEASGVSATSAPTNGAPPRAGTDERDA